MATKIANKSKSTFLETFFTLFIAPGIKVKKTTWPDGQYITALGKNIVDEKGNLFRPCMANFFSKEENWVVFE
jgi:hypothetical protein